VSVWPSSGYKEELHFAEEQYFGCASALRDCGWMLSYCS